MLARELTPVPFVDLAAQHRSIQDDLEETISEALARTDWILGEAVARFEREFAAFCDVSEAVGVDSGLSALELALRAFGIGPGDEVITAANTFVATALAISHAGATPVLVDCDPTTYTLDPESLEAAVTPRTKAVIPVHLYGHPADMDSILDVSRHYRLRVIEDACQAHGARYKGRRVGSLGDAAAFSFYPAKNLGCYGDGGMLVTNDSDLAETVRTLGNYGQTEKYNHVVRGFNRRLDTVQAAILRSKLPHLDTWNRLRRRHAARYTRLLGEAAVETPAADENVEHVWHLYVAQVADRDGLRAHLANNRISTGIHYPTPVHLLPAYADLGYTHGSFPVAEAAARQSLSLPMFPELDDASIDRVAVEVADYVGRD
jgi:dTDP-4-amino-4,6-dideoxygalactose transaminase